MADSAVSKEVEIAQNEAGKLAEQASELKVRSDKDLDDAIRQLVEIKRIAKNIEARRRAITQPLNLAIKEVNDLFRGPADMLKGAEALTKSAMLVYRERMAAKAAKRQEKLEQQAEAGEIDIAKAASKIEAIKKAPSSVSTDSGQASYKVVKRVRISNAMALPAEYFIREQVVEALRKEVEDDYRAGKPIPSGAEVYEDRQVAVRAS